MSAEFSQLVAFKKEFDEACAKRESDIEEAVLEMADYLIATVTPLTPVYAPKDIDGHTYHAYDNGRKRVGGELRKHWIDDNKNLSVRRVGDDYVAKVVNNSEYALYVEEGHKQNVGQKFPVYIDGQLRMVQHKKAYVPGQHFLRKAETRLSRKAPTILSKHIGDFME